MNGNCFCEEKMEKEKVKFSTSALQTKLNPGIVRLYRGLVSSATQAKHWNANAQISLFA